MKQKNDDSSTPINNEIVQYNLDGNVKQSIFRTAWNCDIPL